MTAIVCQKCRQPYPEQGAPYRCPACGGAYDYAAPLSFDPGLIEPELPGLWRYRHAFALPQNAPLLTLGEGATPLVWEEVNGIRVGFKMESLNPTGSYKDRGTAVLVSQLSARGVTEAIEDSSGNAGASFAAYASRARMKARVYVPDSASGPKRLQIENYGAELVRVPGPRSAAAQAVLEEVGRGKVYASHAYMPFGLAGIASLAYELWESLGRTAPGTLIAPVGHGGLLRGILMGFTALQAGGWIQQSPDYVGVQAAACAPLAAACQFGPEAIQTAAEGATIAEGVRVRWPSQAGPLLQMCAQGAGEILAVAEEEILPAAAELGRRGLYVEPTSGLALCALNQLLQRGTKLRTPVIVVLSGSGLKYFPPRA